MPKYKITWSEVDPLSARFGRMTITAKNKDEAKKEARRKLKEKGIYNVKLGI